jgi:Zn-dependent protease with chaperone function
MLGFPLSFKQFNFDLRYIGGTYRSMFIRIREMGTLHVLLESRTISEMTEEVLYSHYPKLGKWGAKQSHTAMFSPQTEAVYRNNLSNLMPTLEIFKMAFRYQNPTVAVTAELLRVLSDSETPPELFTSFLMPHSSH